MIRCFPRFPSRKPSRARGRVLRAEMLEPRTLLSGYGLSAFLGGHFGLGAAPVAGAAAPSTTASSNTGPTVSQPISVTGNGTITGKAASLSVLAQDAAGGLTYTWSVTGSSSGGTVTFNVNGSSRAQTTTATFTKAGTYSFLVKIVDSANHSASATTTVTVVPMVSAIRNAPTTAVTVSGTSLKPFIPTFIDQFGSVFSTPPALTWWTYESPQGVPAPTFTTSGGVTTVTFGMAGYYMLDAYVTAFPSASFVTMVNVTQTLTSITVSPGACSVAQGANQQFTAAAFDQFHRAMTTVPTFTWGATTGTITTAGVFTAPGSGATSTVSAKSGSVTGTSAVTVTAVSSLWQDAALGTLIQSLDADGSISRLDMIQILDSVSAKGALNAADLNDLKTLLSRATTLNIPNYVDVLASNVVNGNAANATYLGKSLGNLAVGSSSTQLANLINKWFYGTDLPTLCSTSLVYKSVSGSLFPQTPSHNDEVQGALGDCYFISALGTLADSNPAAVENMFINNGDGTYTVRFYTGTYGSVYNYTDGSVSAPFSNNATTADYVTVNCMLPTTTTGMLVYADYGASYNNSANSLWIPLAEKAYAQWNQTGKEDRDGTNAYASIQGGWMATVDAQVLGHDATDYFLTTATKQTMIADLSAKEAVTIGTQNFSGTLYGLYADHAYAVIGYNAKTDTFTLYNPWGPNPLYQPGPLTWGQIESACSQFCVANTAGSVPISGAPAQTNSVKTSLFNDAFGATAASHSASVAAFSRSDPAQASLPSSPFSATARASRQLFEALENSSTLRSHPTDTSDPSDGALSASLVDAMFAADGLLL